MKKSIYIIISLLLFSCGSNDDGSDEATLNSFEANITTNNPIEIKATSANLSGTINSITSADDTNSIDRGFCWSINPNPTLGNNFISADGSGLGNFSAEIENLDPNTTYNIRAYISNSTVIYGNNIEFTTPEYVTLLNGVAKNIRIDAAILHAEVISNISNNVVRGVAVSLTPNPDLSDFTATAPLGIGEYSIEVYNLQPNTVYYAKAYSFDLFGNVIYGDEYNFKTTGYFGTSGGYVFFDKGEITDNWRYLEATPAKLNTLVNWGCSGLFIANTFDDIGSGLQNSINITSHCDCTTTNCAAYLCTTYSTNGLNDWFLPSKDELELLEYTINSLSVFSEAVVWSSTQFNETLSKTNSGIRQKNDLLRVWPIRRF